MKLLDQLTTARRREAPRMLASCCLAAWWAETGLEAKKPAKRPYPLWRRLIAWWRG